MKSDIIIKKFMKGDIMYIELTTKRLLLRPLKLSDLDTVHEYASDIENTRFMQYLPNNKKEKTLNFLTYIDKEWQKDEPDFYEFAITLDGLQIGAVSVYLNQERTVGELGWILNKRYWGLGYAFEAASAVKEFAVKQLKICELIATCDDRNVASANLMQRLGLSFVNNDEIRFYPKTQEQAKESLYQLTLE